MIAALVTGTLYKKPEARTSRSGKNFVDGTIKIKNGEEMQFIRFAAFSETAKTELLRIDEGEQVAVQGALKAEIYRSANGEPRVSLSIFADHVLPLRQLPQTKKAAAKAAESEDARPKQERCAGTWRDDRDGPNDQVPF